MNRLTRLFRSVSQEGGLLSQGVDEAPASKALPPLPHVINELGFGPAQIRVFIVGALWLADAAELLVISAASEAVQTEFGLTPLQRSSFITIVFCGVLLGNFFGGGFGDSYGRRLPVLTSFAGIFIFSIVSSFSWSYASLAILRFFVGVCIGMGQPAETALIAEVTPTNCRVMAMSATSILFSIGEGLAACLVYADDPTMYHLHWRTLIAASAAPALVFGIATYFLVYESPFFLAVTGQKQEAITILETMRASNGLTPEDVSVDFEVPEVVVPSAAEQMKVVFSLRQLPITIIMCFSTFLLNVILYSVLYAFSTILPQAASATSGLSSPAGQQIVGAGWEAIGYMLGGIIGSFCPRRSAAQLYMALSCLSLIGVVLAPTGSSMFTLSYYSIKVWPSVGFTVLYLFVAEVFPTKARVCGVGVCFAMGRAGSMVGSPLFEFITQKTGNYRPYMCLVASMLVFNMILLWLMPDAKTEIDEDDNGKTYYGAVH